MSKHRPRQKRVHLVGHARWFGRAIRGAVKRPLALHVEHQDIDGQRRITIFDRGTARLVAHEIDHLNGVLYTDRMAPGLSTIPVSEYRQAGKDWRY